MRFGVGHMMAIQAQMYSENNDQAVSPGGLQSWMDNNGYEYGFNNDFSFNTILKQQLQILQPKAHNFCFDNGVMVSKSNCQSAAFSQSIAWQLEKQRLEIDQFVSSQSERLRLALQEQRKQQLASIVRKLEANAAVLMKQKDEELAKVKNRTIELEDFLRKMEMENQAWQQIAQHNEAMVASLSNTISQLRENAYISSNAGDDAESCCENRVDGLGENRLPDGICKSCNSRSSCVIFLPCRHLCSCEFCESFLDSCPVCKQVKKSTIQALF